MYYLKRAGLEFYGSISYLQDRPAFNDLVSSLKQKEWIVYCKPPFKNAGCVVEYLGRYTHRVAISNNRILKLENGIVTFKWRDYRDNNKQKNMDLTDDEFIRRFLVHILPDDFTKIRHYGLLSPVNKICQMPLHWGRGEYYALISNWYYLSAILMQKQSWHGDIFHKTTR